MKGISERASNEAKQMLRSGNTNINHEYKSIIRADRVAAAEDFNKNILTCTLADLKILIDNGVKFGTVYADPPWLYENQGTRAAASNHYSGMTVEEICALPIARIVAENAHLHLWTTNGFLFDARRVIEAWGFEYKGCFVWVKPQIGIGNYWRVSHEFLLLGVRENLAFFGHTQRSWGEYTRNEHSAKPDAIRNMIEKTSPGPRLEVFGRKLSPGWVVWGNQIFLKGFDNANSTEIVSGG